MKAINEKPKATVKRTVDKSSTASAVKSGSLEVLATPMLLALMEEATCKAAEALLDEGETTVGTRVEITHDKASAVGKTVTASAQLTEVDGRRLCFAVTAEDEEGNTVGKGVIERFVVDSERFMRRVQK